MNFFLKTVIFCLFAYAFFLITMRFMKTKANEHLFQKAHKIILLSLLISLTALGIYSAFFKGLSFASPMAFLLLIPVALFACFYPFLERIKPAVNYNLAYAKSTKTIKAFLAKYLCFWFNIVAICLLILALARPRNVDRTVIPPVEGVEIMLTLDTSISMQSRDFNPDRMTAAKAAAAKFISLRNADKIGIVVFGGSAMLMAPLTLDYDSLQDFLKSVTAGMMRDDGTAIGDAIAVSVSHLQNTKSKSKIIVLLTDGANNRGAITPQLAADAAKTFGIKIYTIGTAGINATQEVDEGLLREIAATTGAQYFRAYDPRGLNDIYAEIDKFEKTRFTPSVTVNYHDRYSAPLELALVLLFLSFLLNKFIFVRIP